MAKTDESGEIDAFTFDVDSEVLKNARGREVQLRPQTARVLGMLITNRGEVVSKDALMREIWADTHVTDDSLVQCISEIRKALGPEQARRLRTVPKRGYLLLEDASALAGSSPGPWQTCRLAVLWIIAIASLATILVFFVLAWVDRNRGASGRPTVAVLPFENVSNDPAQDYFALGLAEDLLTDLSRIGTVKVLSRETTFAYSKDSEEDLVALPARFGATHLVDGSVRRDGNRVRINVQLVEAQSGMSLWAERYDGQFGDIFEVQDEVRAQIMQALSLRLAPGEAERIRSGETNVALAYDLLLRGRYGEATLGRSGVAEAIGFYQQAISVDPTYGSAYARLANMYDFAARLGWSDTPARDAALAVKYAETAIELGPQNPFAYWTYGRILSRRGDGKGEVRDHAFKALRTAIELDPSYADAHAFLALLHIGEGSPAEARASMDKALRLNQQAPYWYLQNSGIIAYMEGDFDRSVVLLERAARQSPTTPSTRTWLAAAYARAGRPEDAAWEVEEAIALGSPSTVAGILASNSIFGDSAYLDSYAAGLHQAGLLD